MPDVCKFEDHDFAIEGDSSVWNTWIVRSYCKHCPFMSYSESKRGEVTTKRRYFLRAKNQNVKCSKHGKIIGNCPDYIEWE